MSEKQDRGMEGSWAFDRLLFNSHLLVLLSYVSEIQHLYSRRRARRPMFHCDFGRSLAGGRHLGCCRCKYL